MVHTVVDDAIYGIKKRELINIIVISSLYYAYSFITKCPNSSYH